MEKRAFDNQISIIKEAMKNNLLVIFAGAGISHDSGVPLWDSLINAIKGELNEPTNETDYLKIAQMLYNEKGEKEYNEIIQKTLFQNAKNYNPLHEIILELEPEHIITTNYDHYFEDVINNKGLPFYTVSKDIDLPYAKHNSLLIKYHGDFDNKNIVLKETDYLEFSQNNTLKETFVKSLFSRKIVLFVGYSVGDVNLKMLIRDLQNILQKHHQRTYLLNHEDALGKNEVDYFKNLGVNIINYCSEALDRIEINKDLSETGNRVFKQLKYILDFDVFKHNREKIEDNSSNEDCKESEKVKKQKENVKLIDDLYNSLKRFDYYRIIPKDILAGLYPIKRNTEDKVSFDLASNYLKIEKKELFELLQNYTGKEDEKYEDKDKEKLNYIISTLLNSGIWTLTNNTVLTRQDNPNEFDLLPKYYPTTDSCDCFQCTYDALKYDEIIRRIETYRITDTSEFDEDLSFAYVLYQIGEYYKAFIAFEEIELKANKQQQMDVSFICKSNMKLLGRYLDPFPNFDDRYSQIEIDALEEKAENINLEKAISEVKFFVDDSQLEFLKSVRDGVYIQRLCNRIDILHGEVGGIYKIVEKGGSASNQYFHQLIGITRHLIAFLRRNFIIGNEYSMISYNIDRSMKAFLIGYALNNFEEDTTRILFRGISKVDSFDTFLIRGLINFSKPKKLMEIITEYQLRDIKITKNNQPEIISIMNNFLSNTHRVNAIWNDTVENKNFTNYLNTNEQFRNKYIRQFENIILILTYFDFDKKNIQDVYDKINRFLEYTNIDLWSHNLDKFSFHFFVKKAEIINEKNLENTLKILHLKSNYGQLYINVLYFLRKRNPDYINDVIDLDNLKYEKMNPYHIPILYDSLSKENKLKFAKRLNEEIDKNGELSMINSMLLNKISVNPQSKKNYISSIHKQITNSDNNTNLNYLKKVLNYFKLLYSIKADNGRKTLKDIEIKMDLLKFLASPEDFDKDIFDVKWLMKLNDNIFLEKFSKINYIQEKLEEYLFENKDERLSVIYFRMKKMNH